MSRIFLSALAFSLLTTPAFAHPHRTDKTSAPSTSADATIEKMVNPDWPNFGSEKTEPKASEEILRLDELGKTLGARLNKHSDTLEKSTEKMKIRVLKYSDDIETAHGDDLRGAASAIEDALGESGILSALADIVADFADDVEVDTEESGVTILRFDGKTLGKVSQDAGSDNGAIRIEGLGQNLSIDRETYKKDGQTKTRIVIEMDGGDAVKINTPN